LKNNIIISICCILLVASCSVKYSFSGASIAPEIKTFSVAYIENQAPTKQATLSDVFTEGLKEKIRTNTRLSMVSNYGDILFEGAIVDYSVNYLGVTASQQAASNRLTITVKITCKNTKEPKKSFEKRFSRYYDFDAMQNISTIETAAIKQISDQIIEDIFLEAFANW